MKFKPGNKVVFSNSLIKFFKLENYNLCQVSNYIRRESADSYFVSRALGEKLPYTAKILRKGEFDNYLVRVTVGKVSDEFYVDPKDLRRAL